ncbi:hypothetical protein ABC270_13290 [Curtobacterium sp. 1P10AnD]|uniref:hypothetical protein n=1 Tax=Curtobacterium sp. 1P10AnD TaxID=3132283 RepID=UPI0039A0A353
MQSKLIGTAANGSSFPVLLEWPARGPQIIAVRRIDVRGEVPGKHLGFDLLLDPAGIPISEPSGSLGFQMDLTITSNGQARHATDGVTYYNGDLVPEWIQLQTGIPADVSFDEVTIELRLS